MHLALSVVVFLSSMIKSEGFSLMLAGGFGAGSSTPKNKSKKFKQRKGSLQEISNKKTTPAVAPTETGLDKWGLPPPTLEDLFPPMPPGTELIPVDQSYSLDDVTASLKDHIDLKLDRNFDTNCVEKSPADGRTPMKLKLLHQSPPVLAIENFFTDDECTKVKEVTSSAHEVNSATFKGALSTRTSTSWFCNFVDVPALLAKANAILNIPIETMEEPQIVRYRKGQEFSWHYDEVPAPQLSNGGQRVATLLVYLNDISGGCGGGTTFRDLTNTATPLVMQPKSGSALLFFPAFRDGRPDDRTLHKSEVMTCDDEKWIVQMWVHEKDYQAILPAGNSNKAARAVMEEAQQELGFA
jgi:prolyl 4-hydroxylase